LELQYFFIIEIIEHNTLINLKSTFNQLDNSEEIDTKRHKWKT